MKYEITGSSMRHSSKISGYALIISGALYMLVQAIHPLDTVANVTSSQWLTVHVISILMDALAIIGIIGLYVLTAGRMGITSRIGFGIFALFWFLIFGFHFAEAFILPAIAHDIPEFIHAWQGLITGDAGNYDIGLISVVYGITGASYILGGIVVGITTARSGIVSKTAGILLAAGAALTVAGAFIPHPYDRVMALPVAISLILIGGGIIRWSMHVGDKISTSTN